MAELTSDMYNTSQSSLPTLHELSASATALGIWRCEMNEYRTNCSLEKFDPEYTLPDTFKTTFANLPSVIRDLIKKYVTRFGHSLTYWLSEHYKRVFYFHYAHANNILYDFDDFVADYYGTIDYAKTAERMMRCDQFGKTKKFKIACAYCLEDDIGRIWPSVCKKIGSVNTKIRHCPELYYWVSHLRNEMYFIPTLGYPIGTVDEDMVLRCMPRNRSSVEYFLNRIPLEGQMETAERLYTNINDAPLAEFILPRLDRHQLDNFVNTRGYELMIRLLQHRCYDERLPLKAWMCVRNVIGESNFKKMMKKLLEFECRTDQRPSWKRDFQILMRLSCEIWHSAPQNLKRSMISLVLSDLGSYVQKEMDHRYRRRDIYTELLLAILSSATLEEKSSFWHNSWHDLIIYKNCQDLQRMMEVFLEKEDAIIQFNEKVLIKNKKGRLFWASFFIDASFKELNDLVDFCCSDAKTGRNFKQRLLKSNFLGERYCSLRDIYFSKGKAKQFDKFINDAFDSDDDAADFKNRLMSSRSAQRRLANLILNRSPSSQLEELREFKEIFAPNEELVQLTRKSVINKLKNAAAANNSSRDWYSYGSVYHKKLLLWCLGSDEEVEKFKEIYGHSYV